MTTEDHPSGGAARRRAAKRILPRKTEAAWKAEQTRAEQPGMSALKLQSGHRPSLSRQAAPANVSQV